MVYGIDRFSEDLDFDCKELGADDFLQMTEKLIAYLRLQGLRAELRAKDSSRLTAYRSNVYFPELLFDLQLTGHREERFLMKIEAQNQGVDYKREQAIVQRNSFLFPVAVPPIGVLLSMKISALRLRVEKSMRVEGSVFVSSRDAVAVNKSLSEAPTGRVLLEAKLPHDSSSCVMRTSPILTSDKRASADFPLSSESVSVAPL